MADGDDTRSGGVGGDAGQQPGQSGGAGPDYRYGDQQYPPASQAGDPGRGGYPGPAGYPGQGGYPGQPGYSGQPSYSGPDHPADPLTIGAWSSDHTQPLPPAPPSYPGYGPAAYPPPTPATPPATTGATRKGVRPGTVIAVAALTALLIGGGAGYAGSRLAERTSPTAVAPSDLAPATPVPSGPATGSASAPPSVAPAPQTLNAVAVAAEALPSTVMIRVGSTSDGSIGSGFVLDRSGLVMTNNHVVADAAQGQRLRVVFADGTVAGASIVGRSPTYDIAVIRVKTSHVLVPMPIGNSEDTRVGESVLAIGAPLGLPGTVTQGIVSARNRPVAVGSDGQNADAYINGTQTDAPINPGNSGGPLIDAGARVIGVNSAILSLSADRQQAGSIGLGFAIPINQAMQIGKMLIADGKATYPVIGADVKDAGDLAGVQLSSVAADGPAARAGLRTGDVVTRVENERVNASEELIVAIRSHRPGDRVTMTYRRGGQQREATVTLGSREG